MLYSYDNVVVFAGANDDARQAGEGEGRFEEQCRGIRVRDEEQVEQRVGNVHEGGGAYRIVFFFFRISPVRIVISLFLITKHLFLV